MGGELKPLTFAGNWNFHTASDSKKEESLKTAPTSSTTPLVCGIRSFKPQTDPLICSSSAGPMSWANLFSEKSIPLSQEILKNYFGREDSLQSKPAFLNFFNPNIVYPLSEENINLLTQTQPELRPYLRELSIGLKGDPSLQFSIQTEGNVKTPEGFEFPLTRLTLFRTDQKSEEIFSSRGGGGSGLNKGEPPPSKIGGVQMGLLFVGGTLLMTMGMDRLGVSERLQGPLMLGAFVGIPTATQFGLSKFGMAEPVTWKGFGYNLNAMAKSWSYFAPYQLGASYLLDKTGLAEMGTPWNTYGSLALGLSPYLAAKVFPRLGFLVGNPGTLGTTALSSEVGLAARGLGAASRAFSRFIPGAGQFLIATTCMGWGMDLGEYITGLEKNPSYQLWRFTRDVMMAKDFGGFLYNVAGPVLKTGANFGYAASQLGDYWSGGTGNGGIEQQAALFTQASKDWGKAMETTLVTLAFEHTKDGKIDRDAMAKSIRELYEGPNGDDIKNAYFLLTVTGYAAKDAQRIKDLIHYDASFDDREMEHYLKSITQEELKNNFQNFMEDRLIQLARQSFRIGPKGNYTDWAFFQTKISDFYEAHAETMREVYTSPQNPSQGQDIRRLISQEGVCRNIPALEKYLKGVLPKQKRR